MNKAQNRFEANTFQNRICEFLTFYIITFVNKFVSFFWYSFKTDEREILIGKKIRNGDTFSSFFSRENEKRPRNINHQTTILFIITATDLDSLASSMTVIIIIIIISEQHRYCILSSWICLRDKYLLRFIDWLLWLELVIIAREIWFYIWYGCGVNEGYSFVRETFLCSCSKNNS